MYSGFGVRDRSDPAQHIQQERLCTKRVNSIPSSTINMCMRRNETRSWCNRAAMSLGGIIQHKKNKTKKYETKKKQMKIKKHSKHQTLAIERIILQLHTISDSALLQLTLKIIPCSSQESDVYVFVWSISDPWHRLYRCCGDGNG